MVATSSDSPVAAGEAGPPRRSVVAAAASRRDDAIWAALPIPAFLIDGRDRIVVANTAAEAFLNSSSRMVAGEPIWDHLAVDAPLDEAMARARKDGSPIFVNDADIGTGSRAPTLCTLQVAPIAGRRGEMLVLVSPRELADRVSRTKSSRAAAQTATGMAQMLAHEIKNPLAGISGAAQLLGMGLDAEGQEMTELIVDETKRITKILEHVEEFGNLIPPSVQSINIHDVMARAKKSAELGFGAHMTIKEEFDPSLPPVMGDPDQLVQVILNLVKNASEAADPAGGTITLRSYFEHSVHRRRAGEDGRDLPLKVEIEDNGPGLPAKIREDIFDPFVSGRENGTGLGLAVVSKIIADHGFWISVDSVPGRTVFRISMAMEPSKKRRKAGAPGEGVEGAEGAESAEGAAEQATA